VHRRRSLLIACLPLLAVAAACSGGDDGDDGLPEPTPTQASVPTQPSGATSSPAPAPSGGQQAAQDGFRALGLPVTIVSAGLPEGWSDALPAYSDSALVGAVEPGPIGASKAAIFSSPDGVEDVLAWYEGALAEAGFEARRSSGGADGGSVLFASEELNGAVIAVRVEDATAILIRYTEAQAGLPGY
jgi:hypothetical protein